MTPAPRRSLTASGVSYRPLRSGFNPAAVMALLLAAVLVLSAQAAGRSDSPLRIVAIGDSLTAGYGLPQGDGLVPQLQRWLDERAPGTVTVVNMGVSGDTTAGGRARLGWVLAEGADAAILALGANDMLRGIDPAETRGNLAAMLGELRERDVPVLLTGMRSSANFGPDYKAAFDAIYPALAEEFEAVFDPFLLEGLVDRPELFVDGLHPNAAGVAIIVERLGPRILELTERVKR